MKKFALYLAAMISCLCAFSSSAQLLVNGGFETGDFSGWTVSDASGFTDTDNDSLYVHSGNFYALLGASPNPGSLLQTLTTTPGETYQLSFWLASDRAFTVDNSFQVLWNGVAVFSQTNIPAPGFSNPYANIIISNLSATGASSTLEFLYVNNDDFFRLDDVSVSVQAVPEISTTSFAVLGLAFLGLLYFRRNRPSRFGINL